MSVDAQKLRDEIRRMYESLEDMTLYELLGLAEDASQDTITTTFRQLVKKWHVDRFSQIGLTEHEREMVQAIFSTLNDAYRVLSDPEKRADYDYSNHDGPNVAELLTAENQFLRGKNMLKTGGYRGAHELFKEAHAANPDEREYKAYLLYTEYLQISKNEHGHVGDKARATNILKELEEIHTALGDKDWLMVFMGNVELGLGNERKAIGWFREATYINPQNHEANRQLRLLEMRKNNNAKNKNFLQRFFGKK